MSSSDPTELRRVLANARVVAVLGAHPDRSRAAWYVPAYLQRQGARILPVNPLHTGEEILGEPVRASLAELHEPVDVVDVFRRPEALSAHLADILAMRPAPRLVWLQSGIREEGFARSLEEAGIPVIQDRCMLADHQRLGVGPIG